MGIFLYTCSTTIVLHDVHLLLNKNKTPAPPLVIYPSLTTVDVLAAIPDFGKEDFIAG